MSSVTQLHSKQKKDRHLAAIALLSEKAQQTTPCLAAEKMIHLVEGKLDAEQQETCLLHIAHCHTCAQLWQYLHHKRQTDQAAKTVQRFLAPKPRNLMFAGSFLAAAACILLFIHLPPQKEEPYVSPLQDRQFDASVLGEANQEKAKSPSPLVQQQELAAPVPKHAPLPQESQQAEAPATFSQETDQFPPQHNKAARTRMLSSPNQQNVQRPQKTRQAGKTSDVSASAQQPTSQKIAQWQQALQQDCIQGMIPKNRLAEGQELLRQARATQLPQSQINQLTQLLELLTDRNHSEQHQCQQLRLLLSPP